MGKPEYEGKAGRGYPTIRMAIQTPPAQVIPQQPAPYPPQVTQAQIEATYAAIAALNLASPQRGSEPPNGGTGGYGQARNQGNYGYSQGNSGGGPKGKFSKGQNASFTGSQGGNSPGGQNRSPGGQSGQRQTLSPEEARRQEDMYIDRVERMFERWAKDGIITCSHCLWGNHTTDGCGYANRPYGENPNRKWYLDWRSRYTKGYPTRSANPNRFGLVPPKQPRPQRGIGGNGSRRQSTGLGNGSGGGNRQNGPKQGYQTPANERPALPPIPDQLVKPNGSGGGPNRASPTAGNA
ncbi:RNA-binding protein cabeza-like [Paramacrobiotus metropolitanus]|uniref:RNA-binding protein cabeza-like n=1 Tax=Paramacrobiotus metropolitanus TaxID=2943436 RepID=UPI002445DB35|nr:RNA-binding protein cabeza-like [Paramacrobiotus metropolitanus]